MAKTEVLDELNVSDKYRELAAAFLRQAEAVEGSNRFFIAALDGSGITLYKQQVRALNLVFALEVQKRLEKGQRKIAVIGSGASGATAAAAAIVLGYEVHLFEQRPFPLHLQHGCDTRWVHPRLYDWPQPGSEHPYAQLPLLNWQAGTAADVAEQILNDFEEIKEKPNTGQLKPHIGAEIEFEKPLRIRWTGAREGNKNGAVAVSAVIFAVGFGVERHVERRFSPSYWRNDSLNQPEPGAPGGERTKLLISGTGDGGLIDLLRACIESYSQGRIIRDLFDKDDDDLLARLVSIKKQWEDKKPTDEETWLYDQYSGLDDAKLVEKVKDRLKRRLRTDTRVTLNGQAKSLSFALNLDKASLFNTLITYILDGLNAFSYKRGECMVDETGVKVGSKPYGKEAYTIFLRHGTDKDAVFKKIQCEDDIARLKARVDEPGRINTAEPIWPAGWWTRQKPLGGERREFVPPATLAIATTFVSTLSDIIKLLHTDEQERELQFRVTLHRLIKVQDEEFFQQISRYAGTRLEGAPGRVFELHSGLGGLACRLGRPVIVRRNGDFGDIWSDLEFNKLEARPINPSVQALLACPFFAPILDGTKPTHVSLMLFMDSGQSDFFHHHDKLVLQNVYAACKGFVDNIERMRENRDVNFSSSEYLGHEYRESAKDLELVKKYSKSLEVEDAVFKHFVEDLTFKSVTSFNTDLETLKFHDKTDDGTQ
jgi:hypothetical protein